MIAHPPFGGSSFKLVAKGLLTLHQLGKDGKDDSPEADSVRDAMDAPWNALSKAEEERAQWLSEDLYSVSEPPAATTQREMNPQAQQALNDAIEARQRGEWDRALLLLRAWRDNISPALLSYLRGSIWLAAGYPNIAAFYFWRASENDPANGSFRASYILALEKSNPDAAKKLAQDVLTDDTKHAPVVVVHAALILRIDFAEAITAADVHRLIAILERNLSRIEKDEGVASASLAYSMTVGLLGVYHAFLGNVGAAVDYYSRGLQVNPNDDDMLVSRGILQYGTSPRAITDFEYAVELRSPVVWPYVFLAHHYLLTSRFEQCRLMCETGLRMPASDTTKSHLEEWRAIAQAELGFPPESVRAAFEAALRLDPSNDLAKRNQDAFEAFLRVPHTSPRVLWEQRSVAIVRQFGLAERRYSMAA
jgi:tetratricopeptide (TPR) repeat protein